MATSTLPSRSPTRGSSAAASRRSANSCTPAPKSTRRTRQRPAPRPEELARVRDLLDRPIAGIWSPSFADDLDDDSEPGGGAILPLPTRTETAPPGTPPYIAALYARPLLSREEEHALFRRMNLLKFRALRLRKTLDPLRPDPRLMARIEALLDEALALRNALVEANLRLVVALAKNLVDPANDFDDLVAEGNLPLIRAVELFDFERHVKFSTYATWAVRNALFRLAPRNRRRLLRFLPTDPDFTSATPDDRTPVALLEREDQDRRRLVAGLLDSLDPRERTVVACRFGLDDEPRPLRFREIGQRLHLSTERVRQLLARALARLAEAVVPD